MLKPESVQTLMRLCLAEKSEGPDVHIIDGITRSGSAAMNGIAPSEMNDSPSSQAVRPFSTSASLNTFGRSIVASASASGGIMPAAMTAAMMWKDASVLAASPVVANR